jgi:hypothetical protein
LRRFLLEVIVYSLLATVLWWLGFAHGLTDHPTIWLAKILHRIAGYPAPYLLADLKPYFWFSPLFPPLVGLMLASRWLSWGTRLRRLAVGLACFWLAVSLQVCLVYSPYLPLSRFRDYVKMMGISSGYVLLPVILWLVLTGGPGALVAPAGGGKGPAAPASRRQRSWVPSVFALGVGLALAVPIFVAAQLGAPEWTKARREMSVGLVRHDPAYTLIAIQEVLPLDPRNHGLLYLAARLHEERGEIEITKQLIYKICQERGMVEAYFQEFGDPPAKPL